MDFLESTDNDVIENWGGEIMIDPNVAKTAKIAAFGTIAIGAVAYIAGKVIDTIRDIND